MPFLYQGPEVARHYIAGGTAHWGGHIGTSEGCVVGGYTVVSSVCCC